MALWLFEIAPHHPTIESDLGKINEKTCLQIQNNQPCVKDGVIFKSWIVVGSNGDKQQLEGFFPLV